VSAAIVASLVAPDGHGRLQLRQAEVEELHALPGDENVGGFEIAMDDARLVRRFERLADLNGVTQGVLD
jgi:hypothetical protein